MNKNCVKCPNCAGTLELSSDERTKSCPYCGGIFQVDIEVSVVQNDFKGSQATAKKSPDDIAKEKCLKFNPIKHSAYLEIGSSLNISSSQKYESAKIAFNIPGSEEVYVILDGTLFGNCKKGFALCRTGIYYKGSWGNSGKITWEQFPNVLIGEKDANIQINDVNISCVDSKVLLPLLKSIQSEIAEQDQATYGRSPGSIAKEKCLQFHPFHPSYNLEIGPALNINGSIKYNTAKKAFNLPDDEEVYIIYDNTILGNCKKGFALCKTGIYYRGEGGKGGLVSWREFAYVNVKKENHCLLINDANVALGNDTEALFSLLNGIKSEITVKER